jgi:hypothetical protein
MRGKNKIILELEEVLANLNFKNTLGISRIERLTSELSRISGKLCRCLSDKALHG